MSTRVLATTLRGLTAAPVGGEAAQAGGTVNTAANTKRAPLRIGVLGAANINGAAIIAPCFTSPEEAKITALAARDRARAEEHAAEHKLEGCVIFDGYDDLIANADVDAIYVPSPNGLHFEWTMKSLEAGFHVLCEKPFASNAEEAKLMVAKAKEKGLVLMEAAHWFYHPFRNRMQDIIASGILGDVQHCYGNFHFRELQPPLPRMTCVRACH
jgi:predicted dehydrogenase